MKKLLMKVIRRLVINAGVQALVIVLVKIVSDAAFYIGQIGKKGSFADSVDLGFEA